MFSREKKGGITHWLFCLCVAKGEKNKLYDAHVLKVITPMDNKSMSEM